MPQAMQKWYLTVMLLCSFLLHKTDGSCKSSEDDHYIMSAMLEDALAGDCVSLRRLARAFFTNQERPPHSVRVKYNLCIPLNENCTNNDCHCWSSKHCNLNSSTCPENSCHVEKEFLWGRIPLIVEDNIYRTLNVCPFMIGGNTEKRVTINFTFNTSIETGSRENDCSTTKEFPCSWCMGITDDYQFKYVSSTNIIDDIATIAQEYSALDQALFTLTEKLQGYAVKDQALPWLESSSDLSIGYAAPYPIITNRPIVLARHLGFFASYTLFQLILFMLIYKYRNRLYRRIYTYINSDRINRAFFYSFVVTSILTGCGMLLGTNNGGYCLSLFQVILLCIALLFSIPHGLIACFKLNKRLDFFDVPPLFCCCLSRRPFNIIAQALVFWLLYSMPHIIMYLSLIVSLDLFYSPFSYLVILMYLGLSILSLWIGNAIYFHLTSPLSEGKVCISCRSKGDRRRLIFGMAIALAINLLYFTAWGFVGSFFYDKRGHTMNYATLVPGFAITLVGWYLSGDLVKVFDAFSTSKTEKYQDEEESVFEGSEGRKEAAKRGSDITVIELSTVEQNEATPLVRESRTRYSIKRLKRLLKTVTRPQIILQESDSETRPI